MVDHRMNVSITNNAQFPLAEIALDASESVRIQTGSMIYHTPNVVLNAKVNAESQSIFGKAIQAVGRSMASGEGVFITEATAQSNNGRLALAPNVPGQIVTLERQSVGRALFGGQGGFYVMSTQGQGTLLVNSFGSIQKVELHNDRITIDNAHVVAWSRELEYDIHLENGFWQSMGTGEGVVNTFYGTGEIYIQSLNIETFANVLRPHLNIDNS